MGLGQTAALFLNLAPKPAAVLQAQTTEIQERVETRLWLRRLLQALGGAGAPPVFLLLVLAVAALALFGAVWIWKSSRKGEG